MILQKNNRKKPFLIFGVIMISAVAVCFLVFLKPKGPIQAQNMLKYTNFKTGNPSLDFTFEYPETGWVPAETAGRSEKYDQVYLRGPVNKENGFTTLIHVTVRPLEAGRTAPDLLEAYLKTDSNLAKFKTLHKGTKKVGAKEAFFALYEYESVPLFKMKAPPVLLKGQMVCLTRNGRSYELALEAIASQYGTYAPVFEHILKTFKFKE
jgi:hypothetical protein